MARLDARLNHSGPEPVALALSGGGDSRALLAIAAQWGRMRGRRILALSVDHRLNRDSAEWTRTAAAQARTEGAQWRELVWEEARAGSGLQNRARLARHALLANAARAAGARVLLMGHTADDAAENHWMQAQGTTMGVLREWAPSPVWPQGRDVVLMRPLLSERRQDLRAFLSEEGKSWIDDPANENPAFHRVRARLALTQEKIVHQVAAPPLDLEWHTGPLAGFGVLEFDRRAFSDAGQRALATALLCAAGTAVPPRGERLAHLHRRLASQDDFVAVLCGARLQAMPRRVTIVREHGEMRRQGIGALRLSAGEEQVWDGRFAVEVQEDGWRVEAAHGWMSRLPDADRRVLGALPPAARAVQPVMLREGSQTPVLALEKAKLQCLVARRFRLNACLDVGETTQEAALFAALHGVTGLTALFSV